MHDCPTCGNPTDSGERYPNSVCQECLEKATTRDGVPVNFFNESISGGFMAVAKDTGEEVSREQPFPCLVNDIDCTAQEAYFGGIVVSPAI